MGRIFSTHKSALLHGGDFFSAYETTLANRCSPECIQEALSKNLIAKNQRNGVNGYSITSCGREFLNHKKKRTTILLIIGSVAFVLCLSVGNYIVGNEKYQKGITAIKENDYHTAEKYLKNLYFKDSQELFRSFKNETYYNRGISAMNNYYYETAQRYFEEVSDYKDSKALAEECASRNAERSAKAAKERKAKEDSKVKCDLCNGTGKVKYYYGSSALEAYLSGHNDYEYGPCPSCDGKGYYYE